MTSPKIQRGDVRSDEVGTDSHQCAKKVRPKKRFRLTPSCVWYFFVRNGGGNFFFTCLCIGVALGEDTAGDRLKFLTDQYARISTVQMLAEVSNRYHGVIATLARRQNDRTAITYWADGEKYRFSWLHPEFGIDSAFNGKQFQTFNTDSKSLILSMSKPMESSTELINPLFAPFFFLVHSDSNSQPRLGAALSGFEKERANKMKQILERIASGSTSSFKIGSDPTDEFHLSVKVEFSTSRLPRIITLHTEDGKTLETIEIKKTFERPLSGTNFEWPQTILLTGFDYKGNVILESNFIIHELDFDQPVDASVFTIDPSLAETVWDRDENRYVKYTVSDEGRKPMIHGRGIKWALILSGVGLAIIVIIVFSRRKRL